MRISDWSSDVCSSDLNLEAMISAASFREDLFYRLAEIVVRIPTLAERPGDAVLLAKHFLTRFAKDMNPAVRGLAPAALAPLAAWTWPGHVRHLDHPLQRAVLLAARHPVPAAAPPLPGTAATPPPLPHPHPPP